MVAFPAKIMWATAMVRFIVAIVMLAVIAGPALAQQRRAPPPNPLAEEDKQKIKDAEAIDKQYKSTLRKTDPAATSVRVDPWQNMRGADDSKPKR
jgi:hypothetical protein